MLTTEAARTFEAMKDDLLRSFPGQFALVCGPRLMGVYRNVDEALLAASCAFDADDLPDGAPILISEIAAAGASRAAVRVMATPYRRAGAPPGAPEPA